ncbi:MAG: molybdopterin molybdotransferase MoeA [Planctomycetia bacterium]|nr:molybdopterin molybdotransferase MoeA [Planctomycetia bacterium]
MPGGFGPIQNPPHDPRMRGFRDRASVGDVLAMIDGRVQRLGPEPVGLYQACGRVLAGDVAAGGPVPGFDRAAMDGYAVRGEETFGASAYSPAVFTLVGRARPGRTCEARVGPGQTVEITTGSALPGGADAVVKVESTGTDGRTVSVVEPTPPGRHVGRRGEDIAAGTVILRAGRVLRPQDLGVLSAVGCREVDVVERPRVTVVVTGDELLEPGAPAWGCRIADMNSVMLAALIARDGGLARVVGPVVDEAEAIRAAVSDAAGSSHVVLISGGSSAGPEDHAPGVVAGLGELVFHGVALRPASPSGIGFVRGNAVLLLPGNPVSCLCAYDFFGGPVVRRLGGRSAAWPYRALQRPLARKLVSVVGRVDYARVRLVGGRVEPLAISGASVLSSTTRADGFVVVPADTEGYAEGAEVTVWLYDREDNPSADDADERGKLQE